MKYRMVHKTVCSWSFISNNIVVRLQNISVLQGTILDGMEMSVDAVSPDQDIKVELSCQSMRIAGEKLRFPLTRDIFQESLFPEITHYGDPYSSSAVFKRNKDEEFFDAAIRIARMIFFRLNVSVDTNNRSFTPDNALSCLEFTMMPYLIINKKAVSLTEHVRKIHKLEMPKMGWNSPFE